VASSPNRTKARSEPSRTNRIIGRLEINHIRTPTLMNVRESTNHSDRRDALFLSILLDGNGCLKQSHRTIIQGKYEIVIYDTGRGFLYDFRSEAILVKIPRTLLISRHADLQSLSFPLRFCRDPPLNALLADFVRGAMSVELMRESSAIVGSRLAQCILELISAVIDDELEWNRAQCCRHQAKLESAQRYITANLGDEKLSPKSIAKHAAVSLRTLNRLFAQTQTTPMRWVWQRRLEASHAALAEGAGKSVAKVASQFGFKEISHFSRSFKAVYGTSPAQIAKSRIQFNE
jgi:AraC-like DNA-binding protein